MTKQEELAALFAQMSAFTDAHPNMSDEDIVEFEAMESKFDKLKADIERDEKNTKRANFMKSATTTPIVGGEEDDPKTGTSSKEYKAAFDNYIRGNEASTYRAEMTKAVDADGGYTVPVEYQKEVFTRLNTLSATRSISTVIGTMSTKNIPIEGEAPTFTWIDEGAAYGETKSTFGNKQLGAYKLGGIIKVSEELLNDTMINFDSYMSGQIAIGIDKAEAPAFCTGDGNQKPSGYLLGLTATVDTTLAATNAISETEIVKIFYALPEAYRKRATWRFNTKTLQKIRNIKDNNGVSIYKEEIKNGTIEGRPFVLDENMADMAASAKPIVFGDFSFYQIGDRGEMTMQRLNEKYADYGLVGFKVHVRLDAKRMLDEAFVVVQNAAS
ncbi:MAG: phage major capsid protein [Sulfurovaceae bacterium]|nr:phage major capsid protein [Sulfurovaceae bacterium]